MAEEGKSGVARAWSNATGFTAFCILCIFIVRGCCNVMIEKEKTEQIKIQNQIKK